MNARPVTMLVTMPVTIKPQSGAAVSNNAKKQPMQHVTSPGMNSTQVDGPDRRDNETEMQLPKYEQVAETLAQEIREARYPEGSLLPTEAQLSARFNASRHTIRHALRSLRERGLVRSRQGRGTEVVSNRERPATTGQHQIGSFALNPFDYPFHLQGVSTVTANDRADVGIVTGPQARPMLRLSGLFRIDGAAGDVAALIFLDEACGDVVPRLGEGSLPDLLADMHHLRPSRILQAICAEAAGVEPPVGGMPSDHPAEVRPPAALCKLVMTRRYLDGAGGTYMVLRTICPPTGFFLHSVLPGDQEASS